MNTVPHCWHVEDLQALKSTSRGFINAVRRGAHNGSRSSPVVFGDGPVTVTADNVIPMGTRDDKVQT